MMCSTACELEMDGFWMDIDCTYDGSILLGVFAQVYPAGLSFT